MWLVWKEKAASLYREHSRTAIYICRVASEQTKRLLEQCSLDGRDQSGNVWP